ncbi:DegV family protein [Mycoplasmopsis verecunda]|uniref:EDD domain protein, DegV family n=1 Tax=Mycoplasmopsis verecunda TaxID=171291 RepID=A0A1T4KFU9_9BACT|nr:DegV family protein [Mycoplasmopsis verecunda]WPB54897.1 DegV family protein [Mycoplasmopsis verecunda]SJZ41318.1 EDD domain protein, DegV family [Mycoplasmopsis verecunda]
MKKLGIILDSFCGLYEKEAHEMNFKFIPLQVDIDGEVYQDGLSDKIEVLNKMSEAKSLKTSSPKLEIINNVVKEASEQYDEVIYLGIHPALSSTSNHVRTVANEYKNVYVFENHWSGYQLVNAAKYALKLRKEGLDLKEIFTELQKIDTQSATYLVPFDMKYMIQGGRLHGVKKFIMTTIKMIPILEYTYEGKVTPVFLKRTSSGAITKAMEKAYYFPDDVTQYEFNWMHGTSQQVNDEVIKMAKDLDITLAHEQITSSVIAIHTGPEAFAITVMPKLNLD